MAKAAPNPAPGALAEIPIREIRGQRVILDADLAAIYGVPTSVINRAVKRNEDRFPSDFVFRLTGKEFDALICQTGISNDAALMAQTVISKPGRGGRRKLPRAFIQMRATLFQRDALAKNSANSTAVSANGSTPTRLASYA